MRAILTKKEVQAKIVSRLAPTPERMRRIADFALSQIGSRYETSGQSGGVPWEPTVFGSRQPLKNLFQTWAARSSYGEAIAASSDWRTKWFHEGNVSKGGTNPDIVPVHARALFIPLSDAAVQAYAAYKQAAPIIRRIFAGQSTIEPRERASFFHGLKFGTDYVFSQKSAASPRPQIPNSRGEQDALARFTLATLKS